MDRSARRVARPRTHRVRSVLGVLALVLGSVATGVLFAAPASAADPQPSDSRATWAGVSSNADTCAQAELSGTTYNSGSGPSNGSTNVGPGNFTVTIASFTAGDVQAPFQVLNGGTITGDSQMVQISGVAATVTINGVVVKGGNSYNLYSSFSGVNMIAPLGGGGNVPALSHVLVCYSVTTPATGSLTVTKSVVGTPDPATTFTVAVDCNDGTSHDATLTFNSAGTLTGGGPVPITGIPAGTQCTVTETGTGSATSVSYNPGGASAPTVTIAADQVSTVAVTNTFTGSLLVTKTVSGTPTGTPTFTVTVDCNDGTSHDATLTFDSTGTLTSGTNPITGIPAGAQCTVTETGNGGATSVSYNPGGASAPTVTIGANQQSTVGVTNTFVQTGGNITVTLNVSKTLTNGAPVANGTQFVLHVVCTGGASVDQFVTFTYPSLGPTAITRQIDSLASLSCTVTETGNGGATFVGYSVNGGALNTSPPTVVLNNAAPTGSVVAQNTPLGSLQVVKAVSGPVTGSPTFTVTVDCNDGSSHDGTLTFNSSGGLTSGTNPITGIAAGTLCTVTETGKGGAISTTYSVNGGSSSTSAPTATISATQTQVVTVTNAFVETGGNITVTLNVNKILSGPGPVTNGTTYVVHVACSGAATVNQDLSFVYPTLSPLSITMQIDSLGSLSCVVTETGKGGATLLGYSVDGGAFNANPPTVVLDNGHANRRVTVENDPTIQVLGATTLPFTGSGLTMLLIGGGTALGALGALALLLGGRRRRGVIGER
jgi:uncharacterized protein DUF5979